MTDGRERRARRGPGARLRAFWNGPFWWLVPLFLLIVPSLIVLIASRLEGSAVPFAYNAF